MLLSSGVFKQNGFSYVLCDVERLCQYLRPSGEEYSVQQEASFTGSLMVAAAAAAALGVGTGTMGTA